MIGVGVPGGNRGRLGLLGGPGFVSMQTKRGAGREEVGVCKVIVVFRIPGRRSAGRVQCGDAPRSLLGGAPLASQIFSSEIIRIVRGALSLRQGGGNVEVTLPHPTSEV